MRAIPIPDMLVPDYAQKMWVGPPPGGEDAIEGIDTLQYLAALGSGILTPCVTVLIEITEEDLEEFNRGNNRVWLTFMNSRIPPFNFQTELPKETTPEAHKAAMEIPLDEGDVKGEG